MERPEFEAWDGREPRDATGFLRPAWRETPPDSTASPLGGFYADNGYGYGPYGIGAYANGGQPEITLVDPPNSGQERAQHAPYQATTTAWQAAYEAEQIPPPPPTRPRARLTTVLLEEPAEELTRRHGARPTGRHRARPFKGPTAGQGRQVAAIRVAVVVTSALFLVAAVAGVTEIRLHGFAFFVSRATRTCDTGSGGLQEDQGLGQPDAPRPTPDVKVQPSPYGTVTVQGLST